MAVAAGFLAMEGTVTYLRLAGFPRHGLNLLDGFVRAVPAAILPPIITRCPLPPHSLHSIPAFIPVPWQRSHGTGSFSCVGGLIDMVAHGLLLLMFGMPRRSLGTHTQHRPNIGSGRGRNPSHWATVGDFCAGQHPWPAMKIGSSSPIRRMPFWEQPAPALADWEDHRRGHSCMLMVCREGRPWLGGL
jgi:hypothetical protein